MAEVTYISDISESCTLQGANIPILMVLSAATLKLPEREEHEIYVVGLSVNGAVSILM
jgi:hypothetical protein